MNKTSILKTRLIFYLFIFYLFFSPPSFAGQTAYETNFSQMAEEILSPLNSSFKIGIREFEKKEGPISPETAKKFNDGLMSALITRGGKNHAFVERADLEKLAKENERFGSKDEDGEEYLSKVGIDLLIVGSMWAEEKGVRLSYKAINRKDGKVLSNTKQYFFELDLESQKKKVKTLRDYHADKDEIGLIRTMKENTRRAAKQDLLKKLTKEHGLSKDNAMKLLDTAEENWLEENANGVKLEMSVVME
ncbi:MAG: hypothetical protein HZA01_17195 [Nitrospinae bacterium]|nr:hypothetical protein [Nitrospinota bacterium]